MRHALDQLSSIHLACSMQLVFQALALSLGEAPRRATVLTQLGHQVPALLLQLVLIPDSPMLRCASDPDIQVATYGLQALLALMM